MAAVVLLLEKFSRPFTNAIFVFIALSHKCSFSFLTSIFRRNLTLSFFKFSCFFVVLFVSNFFALNTEQFGENFGETFLVECVRSGAASCNKRREFWRETHILLWLLIGLLRLLRYATVSSAFHHCTKKPTKCLKGGVSLPFTGSLRV